MGIRAQGNPISTFFDVWSNSGTDASRRFFPGQYVDASGGTKIPAASTGNGYTYHVFLNLDTSNFIVNNASESAEIEILIVAGGGGGGYSYYAGGGGAGGVVHGPSIPIHAGTYPVSVGAGGDVPSTAAGTWAETSGVVGGNSVFNGVTALGGAGGAARQQAPLVPYPGVAAGGSGGGNEGYLVSAGTATAAPQPVPGDYLAYGNPGGASETYAGGGGGGAAGAGGVAHRPDNWPHPQPGSWLGGPGGAGKAFPGFPGPVISPAIPTTLITDIPTGAGGPGDSPQRQSFATAVGPTGLYAGGGGGCLYWQLPGSDPAADGKPAGGIGGGADGAGVDYPGTNVDPFPATQKGPARNSIENTGGGGGGGNYGAPSIGSSGANGIILIRYETT